MADHFANGAVGGNGFGPDAAAAAVANEPEDVLLTKITHALDLIYAPRSTNLARQEAQKYLELVKDADRGPQVGFALAAGPANPPVVRHFGLSILEHAIKHKWARFSAEQTACLRDWVLQLAHKVARSDAAFLRNKVALLWVEVAKRAWAADWMDMDAQLLQLWRRPGDYVHKEFVLAVLESLSDEVLNSDDPVVALRDGVLSKACVDIFTPAAVLNARFPHRATGPPVRADDEGWLVRVTALLRECNAADVAHNDDARTCAVAALAVCTSLLPWAVPQAITAGQCVPALCASLAAPHVAVQKAALEALHALYAANHFDEDEFVDLVVPMYDGKYVDLYQRLFAWSKVDVDDIDDDKYQFAKKFSEMLSCLGNYLDRRFTSLPAGVDVQRFVEFLLEVVQSPSLVVSIPVLVTWTRLLNNSSLGPSIANSVLIGPLLEVCSSRLVRYESLPEDTQDPSYLFLLEDTDTIPERHAFLGNYRRYSSQIIELIVQRKLVDAFRHILAQAEHILQHLYDDGQAFTVVDYNKNSMPVLRVDAHFTVVEAALKGYMKWRASSSSDQNPSEKEQQQATLEAEFEAWCNRLADMKFEDPCIRKRILQLLVAFSITALDRHPSFMLKVLEHILVTWPTSKEPEHRAFNDAIKELQSESMVELQRLATKQPDHLFSVYDQLEAKVNELMASGSLDEKRQIAYQSFLFLVVHRTSRLDAETRVQRLRRFLEPVQAQWRAPELEQALSSYDNFCELVGLARAQRYLAQKRIDQVADWGAVELDAEGLALQADLEARQALLPLRSTKTFLNASVERIDRHADAFRASCLLWQDAVPVVLTRLLAFLDHAHAAHDHHSWTLLPAAMRPAVDRLLTDRFWQSGISEGSKDDFYARVVERKGTLEGLASSIRSTVRYVRETSYAILCSLCRFSVQFYSFAELPDPLARALFTHALHLPPHQIIGLLNSVRFLVDNCPVEFRANFLPPLVALCFQQTAAKLVHEWGRIDQQQQVPTDGDALTEEMKAESILRQFDYCAVMMMADFLDPTRLNVLLPDTAQPIGATPPPTKKYPTLRRFCLMQRNLVEPLMLFCNDAIRIRDGRCCSIVLRVLRTVISEFAVVETAAVPPPPPPSSSSHPEVSSSPATGHDRTGEPLPRHHRGADSSAARSSPDAYFPISADTAAAVREYLSSEVLKSCILSLHEPYFVDQHRELGALIASILFHYAPITPTPRQVLLSLPNLRAEDVDFAIAQICGGSGVSGSGHTTNGGNGAMAQVPPHSNATTTTTTTTTRQQRALVLDLLKDLKGVSVAEMGKLSKTDGLKRDGHGNGGAIGGGAGGQAVTRSPATKKGGVGSGGGGGGNHQRSKMAQEFMTAPSEGRITAQTGNGGRSSPDLEGVAGLFSLAE